MLGQKYKDIFVRFLVQMKTSKVPFEINCPLPLETKKNVIRSIITVLSIALATSVLIVGNQYNKEDLFRLDAPYWLLVLSELTLGCYFFWFAPKIYFWLLDRLGWTNIYNVLRQSHALIFYVMAWAQMAVLFWATVKVFSPYTEWILEDKTSENYGEYDPFVFSTVVLIANWILMGVRDGIEDFNIAFQR